MKDVNVTVRIKPDILAKIDERIKGTEYTRSDFIRNAINDYMQAVRT